MCSNINMHNGFLKISKRCKINCISGHIVPRIYNSLTKKVWSDTQACWFSVQLVSVSSSTTACIRRWLPTRMLPKIVASREAISTSTFDIILWDCPSPKQHLDLFICFCRAHGRDQRTDRQTDHGNVDNRPHLANLKCAQNIVQKQWRNYNFWAPGKHSLRANSLGT